VTPRLLLLLTALAVVVGLPCAWYVAGKLHRFTYAMRHTTLAALQTLAGEGFQLRSMTAADGIALHGLWREPIAPDARWILFVPGNSVDQLAGSREVLAALCGDDDLGMVCWSYRGFDANDGTPSPDALLADLVAQWHLLRAQGIAAARIEVWGFSLGALLATRLVGTLGAAGERAEQPARLVLLAPAPRITLMPAGPLGRFRSGDVHDAEPAVPHVRCPVVVVHGIDDVALPIAGARRLRALLGDRATLHELPGKGHVDLWADARRIALAPAPVAAAPR
jgi:uncharacterized protein